MASHQPTGKVSRFPGCADPPMPNTHECGTCGGWFPAKELTGECLGPEGYQKAVAEKRARDAEAFRRMCDLMPDTVGTLPDALPIKFLPNLPVTDAEIAEFRAWQAEKRAAAGPDCEGGAFAVTVGEMGPDEPCVLRPAADAPVEVPARVPCPFCTPAGSPDIRCPDCRGTGFVAADAPVTAEAR